MKRELYGRDNGLNGLTIKMGDYGYNSDLFGIASNWSDGWWKFPEDKNDIGPKIVPSELMEW